MLWGLFAELFRPRRAPSLDPQALFDRAVREGGTLNLDLLPDAEYDTAVALERTGKARIVKGTWADGDVLVLSKDEMERRAEHLRIADEAVAQESPN